MEGNTVEISEPLNPLRFTYPAKLVAILSDWEGGVTVNYRVSNFGFGPVQSRYVKKALAHVTAALAQCER